MKFVIALCFVFVTTTAHAETLVEPKLTIAKGSEGSPHVALTLDACSGQTDERILQALIANKIPATIFASGRWIKRNVPAVAEIKAHPDLFEVENHGALHVPAVDLPIIVYGLKAAGSPQGVIEEVKGGEKAVTAAFGQAPRWYRGAGAIYTKSSMAEIAGLNQFVAGYTIAGDGGAAYSTVKTAMTIAAAKDGDVILVHVNHPNNPAGAGVVEGVLKLKEMGFTFVTLLQGGANAER